ncbi:angiomotin-like isoform X2 [Amphibalanus amphitrite]|uniref:angiomotin-like isoform X2 n=1 Tax=Amphibalanus amphitrite TaxID=1232801 RepID=UPI001C8FAADC|nr:angiomotin-like isoform X2 [Amphibalanus amphitrite]
MFQALTTIAIYEQKASSAASLQYHRPVMDCETEPGQQDVLYEPSDKHQERQHQHQGHHHHEEPEDGEEGPASSGGPAGSPGSVLTRVQTRFQQFTEDLLMTKGQNAELEKRITFLTEQILAANEEKEALKAEHRAAISRLEEAALAERRRYETALCTARQQHQRGHMDLQLATEELTALRAQLKTLQMEKVSLARQVRDLETEVKARCRLHQNASDQMVRYNQAKNKLNKEVSGLTDWLKRLESESRSAAELNRRLQLLLQHQSLQLQQLAPAAAAAAATLTATCPELEQLRTLLAAGRDGDGDTPPPPPQSGMEAEDPHPADSVPVPSSEAPQSSSPHPNLLDELIHRDGQAAEHSGDGPGSHGGWGDASGGEPVAEETVSAPPPLAVPQLIRPAARRPV